MYYLVFRKCGIETIKVGLVAVFVPPASLVSLSTVNAEWIRIFVLGREWPSTVVSQGIPCTDRQTEIRERDDICIIC